MCWQAWSQPGSVAAMLRVPLHWRRLILPSQELSIANNFLVSAGTLCLPSLLGSGVLSSLNLCRPWACSPGLSEIMCISVLMCRPWACGPSLSELTWLSVLLCGPWACGPGLSELTWVSVLLCFEDTASLESSPPMTLTVFPPPPTPHSEP